MSKNKVGQPHPDSAYDFFTYKLKTPVKDGDDITVTEIKMREPIAKDLRSLPGEPSVSDLLDLAVKISDQPSHVIDSLKAKDAKKILEAVADFLEGGQ